MPLVLIYTIKFSISLAVVFLFYQFVLRKLTFYNWNRIYLLVYTLFSFFIPFIDISGSLHQNKFAENGILNRIPSFQFNTGNSIAGTGAGFTGWDIISLLIITGVIIMAIRLVIQLISFKILKKKSSIISIDGVNLYQVNEEIIPFSFGNAVFINKNLHSEEELQEIIRHEIVHVKQKHSIDIIWSEILCLFNWFNPFAWLLKKAIRQNLEFIADNKVLNNGIDRKQYQYLLLRVIGNNHFSIAQKFNFSSLKKRIAMMNKLKSAKINLLWFLFALPLIAVILLSFRKQISNHLHAKDKTSFVNMPIIIDTVPIVKTISDKGFNIEIRENREKDNPLIIIRDKKQKEIKRLTIDEWNSRKEYYENLYGKLPPPPPPAMRQPPLPPPVPTIKSTAPTAPETPGVPVLAEPPTPPKPVRLPANVQKININNNATVLLKNGETEIYDLSKPEQKSMFEKKYSIIPPPPPVPVKTINEQTNKLNENFESVDASLNGPGDTNTNTSTTIVIKEGKKPLIYLDGKIISQDAMYELNPQLIESIDVLKGKNAEDKYGEKGKDGVIIIKTKSKLIVKDESQKN